MAIIPAAYLASGSQLHFSSLARQVSRRLCSIPLVTLIIFDLPVPA